MKIGIVTDSLQKGGAEWQALLSAAELGDRGHDVQVLTTYNGSNDYSVFVRKRGIRLIKNSCGLHNRAGRLWSLAQTLRDARFDVVHAFSGGATRYTCLAAKIAHVPCVFGGYRNQTTQDRIIQCISSAVMRMNTNWIVNAGHVKDFLVNNYKVRPERIFVVPNGLDPMLLSCELTRSEAKSRLGVTNFRGIISIVANLRGVKNHLMFLRAAKQVIAEGHEALFLLAGEGPRRNELEEMARHLEIEQHVRFLGHCNCIPELLRASDVAALTSISEGLPNALIEAGAAALPAVSTNNGGAAEIIVEGETGYLVPVDDDAAMAKHFSRLLGNAVLRKRMGEKARQTIVEKFSVDAMASRLLDVYERGLVA